MQVVERLVPQSSDQYLSLAALADYAGLSRATLRKFLADPARPLPHFRLAGKILVKRSEFDAWMDGFRARQQTDVADLVNDVLGRFRS